MQEDRYKGMTEYKIAVLAKNDDQGAMKFLWEKYRKPMANVFYGLIADPQERESEAADVFMRYVKNLFNPEQAINQREDWTFFSYLYSGMRGRRSTLLRRGKRVHASYDESADFDDSGALNAEKLSASYGELYRRYNPEDAVIEELCDTTGARRFRSDMSRLQSIREKMARHIQGVLQEANN
jgi:DNA-directed RNA polymerase specialized sigma24 family protein